MEKYHAVGTKLNSDMEVKIDAPKTQIHDRSLS